LSDNQRRDTGFSSILIVAVFHYNESIDKWSTIFHLKRHVMTEPSSAIKPTSTTTQRKGPRGEVRIFATWCKGCHICVEFCPTKVLAMHPNGDHPIVAVPQKCTACHFCDTHCPDLAISVKKIE
jgi:Pyruvate/2-oxoacid:ferredoxin oxidoreductase delta subunit